MIMEGVTGLTGDNATFKVKGNKDTGAVYTEPTNNEVDIVTIQNIAIGAASAPSLAVGATTERIVLSTNSDCWVAIGSNPTAVAYDGAFFLASGGQSYPIKVTPGVTKIAVIQDSSAGYLSIIESL